MNQPFFAPSLSDFQLKQFKAVSGILAILLLPSAALAAGNVLVNVQNGNLIIQGDAGDNNIGVASRLRRALGQGTGMLAKPCLGLGCSTIEY